MLYQILGVEALSVRSYDNLARSWAVLTVFLWLQVPGTLVSLNLLTGLFKELLREIWYLITVSAVIHCCYTGSLWM